MLHDHSKKFIGIIAFLGTLLLATYLNPPISRGAPPAQQQMPELTTTLATTVTQPITGIGQPNPGSRTGLLQRYENKEADFSLRLPQDWTVSSPQSTVYGTLYLLGLAPLARSGPANSSIVIADQATMTVTQLVAFIHCSGRCVAPPFTRIRLRNNIPAQYAVIGGQGTPTTPWYFVEHNGKIIALSIHDPDQPVQALDAIIQSLTFGSMLETGSEENRAAQAARQSLAHQLGLNPYAVQLDAITSVQWQDRCLGIHQTGQLCIQQITPGFAIILSALGKQYQFNTDENGAQVMAAPSLAAPISATPTVKVTPSLTTTTGISEATQVVSAFLTSLQQASSGQQSIAFLSQSAQAEVAAGRTVPTLVGIQNMYRSFGVRPVESSSVNGRIAVQVGLNFGNPMREAFYLIQENGEWRINTFAQHSAAGPRADQDILFAGDRVILDYFQAVQTGNGAQAYILLSPAFQQQTNQKDLASAPDTKIAAAVLQPVSATTEQLIYHVILNVTPAIGQPTAWKAGENERWIELTSSPSGWRINQISGSPLGP